MEPAQLGQQQHIRHNGGDGLGLDSYLVPLGDYLPAAIRALHHFHC